MGHNLIRGVEFVHALRQFTQWDQLGEGDVANLVLVGLANVDQHELLAPVDHLFYSCRINLAIGHCGLRSGGGRFPRYAAELMIVDQFRDSGMIAAHRAFRVPAQLQLAEAHRQGVIEHQPADQ